MLTGKEIDNLNTEQIWRYIAIHLKKCGYDTILVGGAVVAIYSDEAYTSGDLDLIVTNKFTLEIDSIMAQIGFNRLPERRYFATRKVKSFWLNFRQVRLKSQRTLTSNPDRKKLKKLLLKF